MPSTKRWRCRSTTPSNGPATTTACGPWCSAARGSSFCAGQDLRFSESKPPGERASATAAIERRGHLAWSAYNLYLLDKPLIGALRGNTVGGGLGLALACDVRVAAEDARFATIFAKRGYSVDSGVSLLLPLVVGYPRAAELVFTLALHRRRGSPRNRAS